MHDRCHLLRGALRYPTGVKLFWECCEWLHALTLKTRKELNVRLLRSKYNEVEKERLTYAKQIRHSTATARKILHRLIHLLKKLIGYWDWLCKEPANAIALTAEQ